MLRVIFRRSFIGLGLLNLAASDLTAWGRFFLAKTLLFGRGNAPRLDQIRGVRRIDDVVRVAMEDDRARARDISAARPP